ncbi:MAG: endo-1,4-beta-xylanase [Bdellovibrionota bacterium]
MSWSRSALLLTFVLPAAAGAAPPLSLRDSAQGKIIMGASIREWVLDKDYHYEKLLKAQFDLVWPEYFFKMKPIQPKRGEFDFKVPDQVVDFAIAAKQKVKGHTLIWNESLPEWFEKGNFSKKEVLEIMENHIATVVGHFETKYPGRVQYWDVVNEAIDDAGGVRKSKWTEIGSAPLDFVALAFKAARKAAPQAKLFYNDYRIEFPEVKGDRVYEMVSKLVKAKVPIDGIGFQMHTSIERPFDFEELARQMKRYSDLGLEIHISEMDVRIRSKDGVTPDEEKRQSDLYVGALKTCLANKKCTAFITCGFTDDQSWISENQNLFPGFGRAQIFDRKYQPKKVYFDLVEALRR